MCGSSSKPPTHKDVWRLAHDEETGRNFRYNLRTRKTKWCADSTVAEISLWLSDDLLGFDEELEEEIDEELEDEVEVDEDLREVDEERRDD